jgi:hypothetical protein
MKYTVVWTPEAEFALLDLWLSSRFRESVSEAVREMDDELARNPEAVGESRESGLRIAFEGPLGVSFRVFPEDRLVQVLLVWLTIAGGG